MNAREEVLARIAAAHRAAPPPDLRYEDIAREYRTTSNSSVEVLTELLIDRLVDYRALVRECPVARQIAATLVYLPTYPRYDDAEIERNIALIRRFYGYEPVTAAFGEEKEELARDAA